MQRATGPVSAAEPRAARGPGLRRVAAGVPLSSRRGLHLALRGALLPRRAPGGGLPACPVRPAPGASPSGRRKGPLVVATALEDKAVTTVSASGGGSRSGALPLLVARCVGSLLLLALLVRVARTLADAASEGNGRRVSAAPRGRPAPKQAPAKPKPAPRQQQSGPQRFRYHTVRRGETLYDISRKYNTSVAELVRINQLRNADFILEGDVLKVPLLVVRPHNRLAASSSAWWPFVTTWGPRTHTVVEGDTLSDIGARYDVSWSQLAELNGLKEGDVLRRGATLRLPNGLPPPAREPARARPAAPAAPVPRMSKRVQAQSGQSYPQPDHPVPTYANGYTIQEGLVDLVFAGAVLYGAYAAARRLGRAAGPRAAELAAAALARIAGGIAQARQAKDSFEAALKAPGDSRRQDSVIKAAAAAEAVQRQKDRMLSMLTRGSVRPGKGEEGPEDAAAAAGAGEGSDEGSDAGSVGSGGGDSDVEEDVEGTLPLHRKMQRWLRRALLPAGGSGRGGGRGLSREYKRFLRDSRMDRAELLSDATSTLNDPISPDKSAGRYLKAGPVPPSSGTGRGRAG